MKFFQNNSRSVELIGGVSIVSLLIGGNLFSFCFYYFPFLFFKIYYLFSLFLTHVSYFLLLNYYVSFF